MAEQLAPGIYLLELGVPAPLGANAFLVEDGGLTLVDVGLPFTGRRLRREIVATGHTLSEIDRVLVTHYDLDHVGGLPQLHPFLDAPVYIGEVDLRLLSGSWDPPVLHHKGLFHRGARRVFRLPESMDLRPVHDGDRIGGFTAYHTPGHNPGHVVYVHDTLEAALLGDLVWEEGGELTTPEWYDSYDMAEMRSSVRRFADSAPAFELACMAHGQPLTSDGAAALDTLAARLQPA